MPEYMKGKIIFIYTKKLYKQISRKQNTFIASNMKSAQLPKPEFKEEMDLNERQIKEE
jgi:hypothetical protein